MSDDPLDVTRVPQRPSADDWPTLISRIVDDLARIIQTEIRLFQAGLEPVLSAAVDRLLANMVALAAFMAGGICLLAALATFLQRWLGWAASLAITGLFAFTAGYMSMLLARMRTNRTIADLERTLDRPAEYRAADLPRRQKRPLQE